MNDLMFLGITMVLNFILVLTILDFYDIYFSKCEKRSIVFKLSTSLVYYIFSVSSVFLITVYELNILISVFSALAITFYYKTQMINRLLGAFFVVVATAIAEIVSIIMISLAGGYAFAEFDVTSTPMIFAFAISRFIPFIGTKLYKIYGKSKYPNTNAKLRITESIMFVCLPVSGFGIVYYLFQISPRLDYQTQGNIMICMILIFIFIAIFFITYLNRLELSELRTKELLMDNQIEQYSAHYEELKDNLSEFYIYKHDIKHKMLSVLSELDIEQNEVMKKFDLVFDETLGYKFYSNNKSLDMILNYSANKAASLGITPKITISSKIEINVDDKVLCVILGNLIDNSIEACEKFKKDNFSVELQNQNGNLFIKIQNEYAGNIEFTEDFPMTTKENKSEHGKGLISVKRLVNDNNGFIQISTNDNIFKVEVLLANE